MKSALIVAGGLLLGPWPGYADETPDMEFLEFLGSVDQQENWESFFDALPPGVADEQPEPVVVEPESRDEDAG